MDKTHMICRSCKNILPLRSFCRNEYGTYFKSCIPCKDLQAKYKIQKSK